LPKLVNSVEAFRDAAKQAAIQKYGRRRYVVALAQAAGWKPASLHTFFNRAPRRWPASDKVDGIRRALGLEEDARGVAEAAAAYRPDDPEVAALLELLRPHVERIARSASALRATALEHLQEQVELLADALDPPERRRPATARARASPALGQRGALRK
jgi:hypothetical protein